MQTNSFIELELKELPEFTNDALKIPFNLDLQTLNDNSEDNSPLRSIPSNLIKEFEDFEKEISDYKQQNKENISEGSYENNYYIDFQINKSTTLGQSEGGLNQELELEKGNINVFINECEHYFADITGYNSFIGIRNEHLKALAGNDYIEISIPSYKSYLENSTELQNQKTTEKKQDFEKSERIQPLNNFIDFELKKWEDSKRE